MDDEQVRRFVEDGFVRVDAAFPREVADAARAILWPETGNDPADPATWTRPVVRLGGHAEAPFLAAARSPRLAEALDRLVGAGRYVPPMGLGTFAVRFPSEADPGDDGWQWTRASRAAIRRTSSRTG